MFPCGVESSPKDQNRIKSIQRVGFWLRFISVTKNRKYTYDAYIDEKYVTSGYSRRMKYIDFLCNRFDVY